MKSQKIVWEQKPRKTNGFHSICKSRKKYCEICIPVGFDIELSEVFNPSLISIQENHCICHFEFAVKQTLSNVIEGEELILRKLCQ